MLRLIRVFHRQWNMQLQVKSSYYTPIAKSQTRNRHDKDTPKGGSMNIEPGDAKTLSTRGRVASS
jgi:hypothetical protein